MLNRMKQRAPARRRGQQGSVRDRAYQYIQQAITDGVLEAGSGVSELSLAKELGSSRTPIREAMNQLAAEGWLRPGTNGGMVVAQVQRDDIIELYELREALETYSVGKVAMIPLRPADKDRLQFMIDEIQKLREELVATNSSELNADQMKHFLACDMGFHALLVSLTGNTRIHKSINETRLLIRIFSLERGGHNADQLARIQLGHQQILDAVESQNPELAMRAIAEHIQTSQRERVNDYDRWNREATMRKSFPGVFDLNRVTPVTIG